MAAFFAVSSDAGTSSTWTQAAGTETTLDVIPALVSPDLIFDIETQLSDTSWGRAGQLTATNRSVVLTSAGTFRLRRYPCLIPAGVDKT